jgi:hypothetical protein
MKSFGIFCLAIVFLGGIVAVASADEPSTAIAPSSLASMGLGGMQTMSDDEGQAVRGMGAFAGGFDFKHFGRVKILFPFDHQRFDHKIIHNNFDHGKFGWGMDHKNMGGGMIWQPKQMVWNFGGKPALH